MAKVKKAYECVECGHTQGVWAGQCPQCKKWGTMHEVVVEKSSASKSVVVEDKNAKKLRSISLDASERIKSSYAEFDRAVGRGLVRDSV